MIKKIRYKLVYNRSGCLNQRGEGLIQIEAEQQRRKIYFSTHTYVLPEHFAHGCVVNLDNADGLNYALYSFHGHSGLRVPIPCLQNFARA